MIRVESTPEFVKRAYTKIEERLSAGEAEFGSSVVR